MISATNELNNEYEQFSDISAYGIIISTPTKYSLSGKQYLIDVFYESVNSYGDDIVIIGLFLYTSG